MVGKCRWTFGICFFFFVIFFFLVGRIGGQWMELCTAFFRTSSLFCGKMLVTTNVISQWVLPKGRDFKKKNTNLNWHHWTDFFVFVLTCQNLGLLGLVKKKKENNGLKKKDTWTWWPVDRLDAPPRDSRCAVFRNECGLCVLGQCGLASRTCAVASWVWGNRKKWFVKWLVVSISGLNF